MCCLYVFVSCIGLTLCLLANFAFFAIGWFVFQIQPIQKVLPEKQSEWQKLVHHRVIRWVEGYLPEQTSHGFQTPQKPTRFPVMKTTQTKLWWWQPKWWMTTLWQKKMSMLQNDNLCWHCEAIFWGHCKTETEHRLHNRECCVSDLLQQLQQTVRRRNQRSIEQTNEWPSWWLETP